MATMNVSLPAPMKEWVESRADTGRFANASDYVRHLIRADQENDAKIAHMQRLVDEALESGFVEGSPAEIRARIREHAGVRD